MLEDIGEVEVTGSIVFVSDPEAFSNMLWTDEVAQGEGIPRVCEVWGAYQSCWNDAFEMKTDTSGTAMEITSDY